MNKELEFLEEKHGDNSWGYYPPSKQEVAQWLQEWTEKQFAIHGVSQQRELLIAYEKNHYTPQEWALASKQCIEDIDNFLAINCG